MDGIIELAIAVGRLENRVAELERLLNRGQSSEPAPVVTPAFGETENQTADKLLQQGIDNIMSYQWPPVKKVEE